MNQCCTGYTEVSNFSIKSSAVRNLLALNPVSHSTTMLTSNLLLSAFPQGVTPGQLSPLNQVQQHLQVDTFSFQQLDSFSFGGSCKLNVEDVPTTTSDGSIDFRGRSAHKIRTGRWKTSPFIFGELRIYCYTPA